MSNITAPPIGAVSPTAMKPGHDVTLTDGVNTVGFVVVNPEGERDYTQLRDRPIDQMSIQTSQNEGKYSDRQWPYQAEVFDDASGGRGGQRFADDRSKFYYSRNLDTMSGRPVLAGQPRYAELVNSVINCSTGWTGKVDLHTTRKFYAKQFTAPAADIFVQMRYKYTTGTGGGIKVSIYSNSGGLPLSVVSAGSVLYASSTNKAWQEDRWVFSGLTPSTVYWAVVEGGTSSNYYTIWHEGGTGAISEGGSEWTIQAYQPVMVIGTVPAQGRTVRFLEYKRALYAYTVPDALSGYGVKSYLYINGDRGAADANGTQLDQLIDATKTWTVNEFAGCYVVIVAGPGSEEKQPWRKISTNGSNYLTVIGNWKIAHTVLTEYVIVGSNKWTQVADLGSKCKSHAVVGRDVFFACDTIQHFYGYTTALGVWTNRLTSEVLYGDHIEGYYDQNDGQHYLVGYAEVSKRNLVWRARVNQFGGYLLHVVGVLGEKDEAWEEIDNSDMWYTESFLTGRTIQIPSAFSTGRFAVMNLDEPVNIRSGAYLNVNITSNTAITAGHLRFYLSDADNLGKYFSPRAVMYHESHEYHLPEKVAKNDTADGNPADGIATTEMTLTTFTNTDYIYIGSKLPFDKIDVELGSTKNSAANTTITGKFEYWNGSKWVQVPGTITDDTIVGAGTASHAENGVITFVEPPLWEPKIHAAHWGATDAKEALYYIRFGSANSWTASVKIIDYRVANTRVYKQKTDSIDGQLSTYDLFKDITVDDHIYICHSEPFNQIDIQIGGTPNAVTATMTLEYFNGSRWVSHDINDNTISSGKTLAADGTIDLKEPKYPYGLGGVPTDWESSAVNGVEGYWVRLYPSTTLTPDITIEEIRVRRFASMYVNTYEDLVANEPKSMILTLPQPIEMYLMDGTVKSIGIALTSDYGSVTFTIAEPPRVARYYPDTIQLDDRINGMQVYTSQEDASASVWLFGVSGIHEYRPSEGKVIPFMLGELRELGGSELGRVSCVNGVYLYFSLSDGRLERYYNNNLDDIGPDRDEVVDDVGYRGGPISALASYPGRVYAAVDSSPYGGSSNILALLGSAWHDVYLSPVSGVAINDMYHQHIEGSDYSKLWISEGNDILYLPVPNNKSNVRSFPYAKDGFIVLPWIDLGMVDVKKAFRSLEIFGDYLSTSNRWFEVDYRMSDTSSWSALSTLFDTEPSEEGIIGTNGVNGKQIRLRIRFEAVNSTYTPRLIAVVLKAFGVISLKYEYLWSSLLADKYVTVTLNGKAQDTLGKGALDSVYAILRGWADNATILTMNSRSKLDNAKVVALQAVVKRPYVQYAKENAKQTEQWMIDVAVSEL